MNKIRRILKTNARAEREVALSQIVRSDNVVTPTCARLALLPVAYKTKNFLTNPFKRRGVPGGPQKNERKFYGFVFVASLLQKGLINNIAQVQHTALSSVACAERGASSPSLVVTL